MVAYFVRIYLSYMCSYIYVHPTLWCGWLDIVHTCVCLEFYVTISIVSRVKFFQLILIWCLRLCVCIYAGSSSLECDGTISVHRYNQTELSMTKFDCDLCIIHIFIFASHLCLPFIYLSSIYVPLIHFLSLSFHLYLCTIR